MNQSGKSKVEMLVQLVIIFFISLLSFSVGTFVGKQFSDSQHKLEALEGEGGDRGVASVSPDATEVKPEDALSDEDIAQLTEEFAKGEKKAADLLAKGDKHSDAPADKGHEPAGHAEKADKAPAAAHSEGGHGGKVEKVVGTVSKSSDGHVSPAAERVAGGHSPEPTPKPKEPSRIPSSLPDQVAAQNLPKFFIQVASYAKEDEADKRVEGLKGQGFSAYSVKNEANGKTWYRVGIGAFATETEARDGLKKVQAAGLNDAFVQKIVR